MKQTKKDTKMTDSKSGFLIHPLSATIGILFMVGAVPAALAQTAEQKVDEVVVTGSRIRGVAPVGSPVIALGREQMELSGATNTNDLLRQIPQVTNIGTDDTLTGQTSIQNSAINVSSARSINLRGLGTASTLTLINGHRIAPGGVSAAYVDADSVPSAAIQRMEVVADGASAIYGSDAVAGVANMVLRNSFEGGETTLRYGKADGTSQWLASNIYGKSWETGGFALTLEKSRRNPLYARDRRNLYNDDLRPFGGSNAATATQASPGNVTVAGVNYGIPTGQNGQNFTLGQLTNVPNLRSTWDGDRQLTPRQDRETVVLTFEQELSERFSIYAELLNSSRDFYVQSAAPASNLTITPINTNSPCFAGKSTANAFGLGCAANLTVPYSFVNDLGYAISTGTSKVWDATVGLKFSIAGDWKGEASATKSKNKEHRINLNSLNNFALGVATTGSGSYKGGPVITKPSNVPYFNPFCDGNLFTCNDPATIAYIKGYGDQGSIYDLNDYNVKADGSLFSLPGGNVRLAVGAEYHKDNMYNFNDNTTGGASVNDYIHVPTSAKRDVTSYFAEVYIPLIGASNATPWAQRLDLSLAGRAERYSDFGDTRNPKLGLTWAPVKGLEFTSTYGSSFRAPTLCDINPDCTVRFIGFPAALQTNVLNAIAAANPGSVNVNTAGASRIYVQSGGGTADLKPEKAKTFSLGFNIRPALLTGVELGVNYYQIKYTDRISTPGETIGVNALSQPGYAQFVDYNPLYFPVQALGNPRAKTQAQFDALLLSVANNPNLTNALATGNVLAYINGNRLNTGTLKSNGLDLSGSYTWKTTMGEWRVGGTGTYVNSFKTSDSSVIPISEKVNKFSYPLRFKGRGEFGWKGTSWNATTFINYANSYNIETAFLPVVSNPSNYLQISSYTTADLTVNYKTGKHESMSLLNDIRVSLNIQNVFDRAPPFVLNSSLQFDPLNASATGRYVSLQVTKSW